MRDIVVLVKSAVDEAELKADASGRPALKGAAKKLSNFDRIGVEEALRLREAAGGTVSVLATGRADARYALKDALAMGADKGLLLLAEGSSTQGALETAIALGEALKRFERLDLVICSEGSSDTYQGQVGAMVSELAGLPFLAYAKNVSTTGETIRCEQVFDTRTLVSEAKTPAVVSMVNGANHPRYPTLLQVMAASKKPLEELSLPSLAGVRLPETGFEVSGVRGQTQRRKGIIFEGPARETARSLVEALRSEGLV